MTGQIAFATICNIAFAIAIAFAVPIVMPVAATLAWVLIVLDAFFILGIIIGIAQAYATPQE